ncbi:hypothetical protein ADJ70_07760 [Olsenella sp. oral taxon 807]|nr:hypothetical protein ADJ70_07760 [Olsenella sp. oral taxon 807]
MQNAILTHINFYLAKPRRVGNGIVENVRIRNEPCITMTEVFLRFTGQATISYTQLPQLTLFPSVCSTRMGHDVLPPQTGHRAAQHT